MMSQIEQRKSLVKRIKEGNYDNVIEEVAYTWFNRIISIRFMEVNDYLPTNVRVLSSEKTGKIEPDIVTKAHHIDLNFSDEEKEKIYQFKNENKLDELFRFLFIKQCNKLNEILPELFEETADYTELLLSISFTDEDGVVRQLVDNISENDFKGQVEIIGWLYQYYNTELKEDTFKQLKKGVKISKERIPAVTQLFTPDWIVRYMVENSLGRLWLEGHPDSDLKENWKYYLEEAEQEPEVQIELQKIREDSKNITPENIKVTDPAMGSGHILVYAFEVLMQIYTSVGYAERDAAISILENNLYGLDIDDRAYQLAYFAVMMKARAYNRQILTINMEPHICSIQESNSITDEFLDFVADGDANIKNNLKYLVEIFKNAKEYGSIIDVETIDFSSISNRIKKIKNTSYSDFKSIKYQKEEINNIYPILKQAIILSRKYEIAITNPPYMGNGSMNLKLSNYLKKKFPDSKKDLFAVFIIKCLSMVSEKRYLAMITQQAFMFLPSYETLRQKLLKYNIVNMSHLGARAFEEIGGEVVQTTSFIIQKSFINQYKSKYLNLVDYNSQKNKEKAFLNKNNVHIAKQDDFTKISGSPIAYWVSENYLKIFKKNITLGEISSPRRTLQTGDSNRFIKYWYEVSESKTCLQHLSRESAITSGYKWFMFSYGGTQRKWYGNLELVVNWENNGLEIKSTGKAIIPSEHKYFIENLGWSKVTSGDISIRYYDQGIIPGDATACIFDYTFNMFVLAGYMNSMVVSELLKILSPTLNYATGTIAQIPIKPKTVYDDLIIKLVKQCIKISKIDWNSFETSWDFVKHHLLAAHPLSGDIQSTQLIEDRFNCMKRFTEQQFSKLKQNEEELNRIFIEIYGLQDEDNAIVQDKNITIRKTDLKSDIKSFISYIVGCMFGRYSLDVEGLAFAGGDWNPSKYLKFLPNEDNIIPILDTEYFEDDIVSRFIEFIKISFGKFNLEDNLDFIASALKKKGNTNSEIIRNYFLTDFYRDHLKIYKKRPIYWLFDSGKENGFKALIYMHRYESDLVSRIRIDYLHKTQKSLESAIANNEKIIENTTNSSEKSKALKANNKLVKQLEETRKYDKALAHIANQRIKIDLDDGVKVNYAKFQGIEISAEGKKESKIDLLKKL